jgi:Carboxypeptidase regulatory-like domain
MAVATAPAAASAAGSISGTVTEAGSSDPIAGVRVCASSEDAYEDVEEFCVHSGPSGDYSIPDLPADEYLVAFLSGVEGLNYLYQAWDEEPVSYLADRVTVAGAEVPDIDAELSEGGQISGTVVSASSGAPIPGVQVCGEPDGLYNVEGCTLTDAAGKYTIVGLGTATYWVDFFPPEASEFLEQYFDHEPGILAADDVAVTVGNLTAGIDAALVEAGQIAGTVTDARTHAPLAGVDACAWGASGNEYLGPCAETDAAGHYLIRRVPTGVYNVSFNKFFGAEGYSIWWYRCSNGPPGATPVSVVGGSATRGIDAALVGRLSSPCEEAAQVPPPPPPPVQHPKAKKCRKGFKRKWVRGRRRCVKVHRKSGHRHHRHRAQAPS